MKIHFCFLFASFFLLSACCDISDPLWIIDPPEPCEPSILLGSLPLTDKTRAVLPAFTQNSRLVFVDAEGAEQTFPMRSIRESSVHANQKLLCSSPYGDQYEYYDAQSVQYYLSNGDTPDYPFINYVVRVGTFGEQLYDEVFVQAHWDQTRHGSADFVTDDRTWPLDPYITDLRSNEHLLGAVTLLGRSFPDVIFVADSQDPTRGFYFQNGLGVVGFQLSADELWVLDRVE